ncbi:MAG: hypothetical protein ACRDTG_32985 [Pseudonocardiaceae bacterium]
MGLGRGWARLVERRRERKRLRRRRTRRGRMAWQTCRQCGSVSFFPTGNDRLCGGCLLLR